MDIEQLSDDEYLALAEPRPHRFPDREPSDSCYSGVVVGCERKACRCQLCRDAHAAASRERQQAQRAGLWVDGRRAIRSNAFLGDLVELAGRVPELYALLRKHGHVVPLLQIPPEHVVDEPVVSRVAASGSEPVVGEREGRHAGTEEAPETGPLQDGSDVRDQQPADADSNESADEIPDHIRLLVVVRHLASSLPSGSVSSLRSAASWGRWASPPIRTRLR